MLPILYEKNETDFNHNGLGVMADCISAVATEELNGSCELKVVYDLDGPLADAIDDELIIKAKMNDKQDNQLFRIYSHEKSQEDGTITIYAQHITYDLANNFVEKVEESNVDRDGIMKAIQNGLAYPTRFELSGQGDTTSSTKLYRTNPLQMIAGIDGSVLDNWGGEILRDNFRLAMLPQRGIDDGVLVAYKKNLTGLTVKFDLSSVVTRIYPFKQLEDGTVITLEEKYVDSTHINDYAFIRILPVDFGSDESVTDEASLRAASKNYFTDGTHKDLPNVSLEVKFESLWNTDEYKDLAVLERVGMGDTITVKNSKMGYSGKSEVIKIEFDVIAEKNIAVESGAKQSTFTESAASVADDVTKAAQQAVAAAGAVIVAANGKNHNYYSATEPVGNLVAGDLWFQIVDGDMTRMYRYDGTQWVLVVSADTADAKSSAQEALDQANAAVDKANQLSDDVGGAVDTATEAINTANASKTAALAAQDTAANAASDAAEAKDNAAAAMTEAQKKADADSVYTKTEVDEALDAYAKVTTVNTLTGRVDSAETRITETENEIMVKADKSTVDTLTGQVSTLSTEVSTQADQIAARITKADADAKYATQTSLKATNDSLLVNINQVQTNLDGLQVGGTNLIRNGDFSDGLNFWKDDHDSEISMSIVTDDNFGNALKASTSADDKRFFGDKGVYQTLVTLSGYFKADVSTTLVIGEFNGSTKTLNLTTDWQYLTFTYANKTNRPSFWLKAGTNYYFAKLKYERGNKATDWSPAPEDLATATQFTQLSASLDGISTQVGRKLDTDTFNSYKTQTASTIATLLTKSDASGTYVTQSAWTQKNNSISSEINQAQTDAQNYADSRVTQTANSLQTTITAIKNKDKEKCIDPSFENGLISIFGDAFMAVGSDNGNYHSGTKSIRASGQSNTSYICNFPVYPGMKIRLSWWVRTTDDFTCATDNTKIRIMLNGVHWVEADLLWTKGVKTDWTYDEKVVTIPDQPTSGQMFFTATVNTMIQSGVMKIDDVSIMDVTDEQQVQSQISQLSDDINLRVQKNDVVNQINVSTESILIAGKKIHITGDTTFDSGVVKAQNIDVANLAALSADLGTVTAGNLKAVTITGSVITGSTIQTATSGPRIELSGNILQGYAANGSEYLRVDTTAGGALQLTRSSSATIANLWGGGALMLGNYDTNKWIGAGQPSDWGVGWSGDNNWLVFGNPGGLDPAETAFDSNVCLGANNQIMVNWGGSLGGFLRLTTEDVGGGTVLDRATINIGAAGYSLSKCPKIYADGYNQLGIANADVYINNGKHLIIGNFDLNSAHTFSSLDGGKVYFATNDDGGPAISIQAASFDKASQIGLKENFAPMDPVEALTNILNTDVVRYNYKGNPELQVGLVIDDRQQPEYHAAADFVTADREAAKTDTIVGELMLAVKALHEKNQELESRIAQLEAA